MAYNYASRRSTGNKKKRSSRSARSTRKKSVNPTAWWGVGVFCGLFLAFLLNLWGLWFPVPNANSVTLAPAAQAAEQANVEAESTAEEPQFEFYEVLAERQIDLPTEESSRGAAGRNTPFAGRFYLQAGAFAKHNDADRRRAQVILLGMDATVESARRNNGSTFYRVKVGPFANEDTMLRARSQLHEANIDTLLKQSRG